MSDDCLPVSHDTQPSQITDEL